MEKPERTSILTGHAHIEGHTGVTILMIGYAALVVAINAASARETLMATISFHWSQLTMPITMRTGRLAIAAGFLLLTAASRPPATTITLSNLRLNNSGLILVDVMLTQAPPPTGGVVDIEFSYVDGGSTITETVRGLTGALNTRKAISSRQPFPCNKTLEVTATLKSPGQSPVYTKSSLSRRCTLSQGTPDLTVAKVERVDGGGLQSPRETVIRVRVTLANIGSNMPFNEQGGTPWTVQLTPGASGGNDGGTGGVQVFRIALSANQRITVDVMPVALQCGRLNPVTVVIDRDGVIREANENNNRLTVDIPGNRCQDA